MSEHSDVLQVEGINSKGFGIIPKLVMQDSRLSIQSKAIYAYFCSFAGAGKIAFPRVTRIIRDLGVSKNNYYKHFGLLREYGYIKSEQTHKDGRLSHNTYTLMTEIQSTKICDTVQCTKKQDTVIQDTVICDTNINNSFLKTTVSEKQQSVQSVGTRQDRHDISQQIETYTELIKDNISYEDLKTIHPYDIGILDEIVAIIVDVLVSDSPYVRVDGENKPRELVRSAFMKLSYSNIECVVGQFQSLTERVKKKRQYFITMLYNSHHELDAHYTNEVRSDMANGLFSKE